MIQIVKHTSGKWFIALNAWWENGELVSEYAWTGWTWIRAGGFFRYFDSKEEACEYLEAHRDSLGTEFLKIAPRASAARCGR
jgi:hypothetical protein